MADQNQWQPYVQSSTSNGSVHITQTGYINDPTIKVKLPSNILSALGNTHANLQAIDGKLDVIHDILIGTEALQALGASEPRSALAFAQRNAELTWDVSSRLDLIIEALGRFDWGSEGELVSMG